MTLQIAISLTKIGLLTALLILFAGQTTKAQTLDYGLRAHVPFDFKLGNKTLPAGEYYFKRAKQGDDLVLQVTSFTGDSTMFRNTIPVETLTARDKGLIVFHRYDNEYFLSQVWAAGALTGRSLTTSRSERQLQHNGSDSKMMSKRDKVESEVVTLVAY